MSTSTFQPTAVSVPFLIPADEPLANCPVFASGIYFNSTYLVFVLNESTEPGGGWPGPTSLFRTELTTYTYPISASTDGSYGFGGRVKAAVTRVSHFQPQPLTYAAVSCVRVLDVVYVFTIQSDWQTVQVVEVTAQSTPGVISAGLHATLSLPGPAVGFVPVAQDDGTIQFLYPDATLSQFDSYVYDPRNNTVTAGTTISVAGPTALPYSNLSIADVPLASGAQNVCFTDASNQAWIGAIQGGAITNPTAIGGSGGLPAGVVADLKAAAGPMIGQATEASVVYFYAGVGGNNPINYLQAPLNDPTNTGEIGILGYPAQLPHNIKGTFVSEAYLPLPGSDTALLRMLVYGAVLGGGLLWLYAIPTGQLVPLTPVITDTSKTDTLSPEQKAVYEQSWTLLGIIQGPPPYVDNPPAGVTPTSAQIDFSQTTGATSTVSYGVSVSAGGSASGEIFSFSGSASYALKQTTTNTQKFTVDQTFTLGDSPPNTGLVIVSQPTISNTEYQVYAPDGSGTYLNFSFYLVQVTDVVTTMFDFDITNPSAHTFSNGLTALPKSKDLSSWQNLTLPTLPQAMLVPPALTATAAAGTASTFSGTTEQDVTTSNKVSISATFGVFGFSASVGFTWSNSTETSSSFTSSYSSTIAPIVANNPPLSTDVTNVQIQPYIMQTTGATAAQLAGLVPTIYTGSTPWILTWRVLNFQTGGSGNA